MMSNVFFLDIYPLSLEKDDFKGSYIDSFNGKDDKARMQQGKDLMMLVDAPGSEVRD